MDFQYLYLKTEGRISRKTWWIGTLIMIVAVAVVQFLILPLLGLGTVHLDVLVANNPDREQLATTMVAAMQAASWGNLIIYVLLVYPAYCLGVKRRHDRNNKGLDLLFYLGASVVLALVQVFGMAYTIGEMAGVPMPMPTLPFAILGGAIGIFGIYLIVVMGFLKGTAGANDFGADPLVKA